MPTLKPWVMHPESIIIPAALFELRGAMMLLKDIPQGELSLADPATAPQRRRSWRAKFRVAFRGMKLGIRGHSSFFVHFFFSALVVAAGVILRCDLMECCVLLGCMAMVITAELFNSALETLFRGLDEATRKRVWPALDVAAGAVLFASIAASIIGCIVLLPHLATLFK
ncbi:MAG: diacylglycerol kinase [Gemmataceae bacterium]